jgi:hypothetical protein
MLSNRAVPSPRVALTLMIAAAAIAACDRAGSKNAEVVQSGSTLDDTIGASYKYASPPPVRTYPSSYATIQRWIDSGNTQAIRAHGWDIWQSITSTTPDRMPTWQTWFSGQEIFPPASQQAAIARPRHGIIQFRAMRQQAESSVAAGADTIRENRAERVFAFNRFTKSTAEFIWNKGLNKGNKLRDTSIGFARARTPLALREVLTSTDSTDSLSFVLKPVFQFISDTGVTAVPYWAGDSSAVTTDSANPIAKTWKQAVAVSPSGQYKPGDSVKVSVNGQPPRYITVVPLSAFYHVRITVQDSANFTQFGAENGDFIGVGNDTAKDSVLAAVRPGNYGLLMAMHVTGKEIPNWTWQSFWWAYNPNDPEYGADRPKSIPAPWNHYNMTVAYSMLQPNGQQLIAYNPYLETSLGGSIPTLPPPSRDSTKWTGVTTNCMSCHRRAAIGYSRGSIVSPPYGPDSLINPADKWIFTQPDSMSPGRVATVKTDFLWSIVVRASVPTVAPMVRLKPTARGRR